MNISVYYSCQVEGETEMFEYAVKTEISNEYFTVLAHGTKRDMFKFAEQFDTHTRRHSKARLHTKRTTR